MKSLIIRSFCLVAIAVSLMGNKGCKEKQNVDSEIKPRALRWRVELERIKSAKIQMPDQQQFDFEYVANAQLYEILMNSDRFTMPYQDDGIKPLTEFSAGEFKSLGFSTDEDYHINPANEKVACVYQAPHAYIRGDVLSFELTDGFGLGFGFSKGSIVDASGLSGKISFEAKKFLLDVEMMAYSHIQRKVIAVKQGDATQKYQKINLSVGFANFVLEPSYFFKDSLSLKTKEAFTESLTKLAAQLDNSDRVQWHTFVRQDNERRIAIVGGSHEGIQIGDEFEIYHGVHNWSGAPCASSYEGFSSIRKAAEIKIVSVGAIYSWGEPTFQSGDPVQEGDLVLIKKLIQPEADKNKKTNSKKK